MPESPAWDLERFRPLLRLQARRLQLDPRLQRRFDSSDLIQETLMRAHAHRAAFRGTTEAELVRWLQEILAHAALDLVDRERAQKRDAALERSLQEAVAESTSRLQAYLADRRQETPSRAAQRQEALLRLAAAIDELPEDQRDAVVLRDLMELSVAEAAQRLERTEKSVAGLLLRGRRRLRELLADLDEEGP
jgi:RNA polymerase sigma-70 factor (ECF subfamily)